MEASVMQLAHQTLEVIMSTSLSAPLDLASARARNESTWRAAAVALYAGDVEQCLTYWTDNPRYAVAYPVDGVPAVVEGRDQFRALFGGFAAVASTIEVHDVRFHQTDDAQVAIVEERMVAQLHSGHRYENLLVIKVTFADGLISDVFEYYGEIAHQAMLRSAFAAT
jgi:ketosteroid isomerase-like protein